MAEVIEIKGQHYVLATSQLADESDRVLKCGDTFAVFNRWGDVYPIGAGEEGLFHKGTRFLSRLEVKLGSGQSLLLLSSRVQDDNSSFIIDLTNPDIVVDGQLEVERGTLHISRNKQLDDGACIERIKITNFSRSATEGHLSLKWSGDFADIFEVRGTKRLRRGTTTTSVESDREVVISYLGLDDVERQTKIAINPVPRVLEENRCELHFKLDVHEETEFLIEISCSIAGEKRPPMAFWDLVSSRRKKRQSEDKPRIITSNEQYNLWIQRSYQDLEMLSTNTPHGRYPYAGIPWFSTVFGRDGIITGLETLWFDNKIAEGVLRCLAALQADEVNLKREAEPGKMVHEVRTGEMAALGEIPFEKYYGGVDTTPLFVVLAEAYYEVTNNKELLHELWPNILRALEWMDEYGVKGDDGLIWYYRVNENGLKNQCWKDSDISMMYADGTIPDRPLAVSEVQAYAFRARKAAAKLALVMGDPELSKKLLKQAAVLKESIETYFWLEDLSTYALALDDEMKPLAVRSSNAGHLLFGGVPDAERAERVRDSLLSSEMDCGWGIRTLSSMQPGYNPMAYHNGSVWPHDNALIAAGFGEYGFTGEARYILESVFRVSTFMTDYRLPELWCGFPRLDTPAPVLYPVACSPQAWAAGTVFLLLQATLGLSIHGARRHISVVRPTLPDNIDYLDIWNLPVGSGQADLHFERHGEDVSVNIRRRTEGITLKLEK